MTKLRSCHGSAIPDASVPGGIYFIRTFRTGSPGRMWCQDTRAFETSRPPYLAFHVWKVASRSRAARY
jgi:hypothetical protein